MLHISGRLPDVDKKTGYRDDTVYLLPVSCGYRQVSESDEIDYLVERAHGRVDYQFMYVQEGAIECVISGRAFTACAGQVLLIRPNEPQTYRFPAGRRSLVYWMHCTGYGMEALIDGFTLDPYPLTEVGQSKRIADLYLGIMRELQQKETAFGGISAGMALQLIHYILRKRERMREETAQLRDERVDQSIMIMQGEYMLPLTEEELARRVNLSVSRYIHLFTALRHMSPMRFLNALRVDKAKEFLNTYDMSIREISDKTGFQTPQYFSRVFRQLTGMTPSQYRRSGEE